MEIPMSSGQFTLGGMDGVEGLQAIHPSQLSIGSGNERLSQLSIGTVSQSMDIVSHNGIQQYGMSGIGSPQNNNTMTSITSSPYISSIMSDPCIFAGSSMEYGVIGTSEQPDTKDGLEELCPVCGDKAGLITIQFDLNLVDRQMLKKNRASFRMVILSGLRLSLWSFDL